MASLAAHRRFFAEYIVRSAASADERLIDAFASVPRENFVGPGPWQVFVGSAWCVGDGWWLSSAEVGLGTGGPD